MSEKLPPPPQGAAPGQIPGQPYPQYQGYPAPNQPPYGSQPVSYPAPQAPPQAYPQQPYGMPPSQPQYATGPTVVVQQPLPVVGMSVSGTSGNRNVRNLPRNGIGQRAWNFDLFSCFDDCGTCMLGWCCPCVLYAQLKQRLDYLNLYAKPDPTRGGSGIDSNCMVWCLLHAVSGCGFIMQVINRGNMRNRYQIEGDGCADFFTAWCCTPCELTQEHRELELEENSLRV